MNNIYGIITTDNALVFIINTDGDNDFWYWEVSTEDWKNYFGLKKTTLEMATEFINDEDNATLGCSCGSFDSVADAVADYFN